MKNIRVVFQQPTFDLNLSVILTLTFFAALHGLSGKLTQSRADAVLDRLITRNRSKETVRNLSGGHRRRLEIARCLILLLNGIALMWTCVASVVFLGLSVRELDPARGLTRRMT